VVDLEKYEENDLGTYENIEIKFKSGKTQRTKPTNQEPPKQVLVSGVVEKESKKEIFLKEFFLSNHALIFQDTYLNLYPFQEHL